jgi:2,4-dienoyl-CoA reductase-like NADH-dependent reductase (Old Yellow Enzyme family)
MDEGFQFVAMGRALLMEPDFVDRIRQDAASVSRCIHCNRCMPTIYRGTHCPLTVPRHDISLSSILLAAVVAVK